MTNRRAFARDLTAAAAAVWLAARRDQVEAAFAAADGPLAILTAVEAADLEAIAALIVPADDTPGAREAGVVGFLDRALGGFAADQLPVLRDGLARLRKRAGGTGSFATLAPARQLALLKRVEKDDAPFFRAVRAATLFALLGNPSRGGNRGKVGWRLIGFEDRFFWQPPFGDYDRPDAPGDR
jgi:gluconate 2-dehydrogenase gamma chain